MPDRYLLISGRPDRERVRTSVSVFASREEAKQELARLTDRRGSTRGWVELASIDEEGRLVPLCRSAAQGDAMQAETNCSASAGSEARCTCT